VSTLVLVRHAQARPFEPGPDGLSALGEAQARRLGEYWAQRGITFDSVWCGSLARQARTAELAGHAVAAAGLRWPAVQTSSDWNEYDADGILGRLGPLAARSDPEVGALAAAFEAAGVGPDRHARFQRMFERVMAHWARGTVEADGVESAPAFRARVERAFAGVTQGGGPGQRIAVFTSGGPIGLAVQRTLLAPPAKALELNWRIRNCSLTEILFSGDRVSLDCFNSITHLAPALWSYR
jgi:broad specificity phosphatase PhoE